MNIGPLAHYRHEIRTVSVVTVENCLSVELCVPITKRGCEIMILFCFVMLMLSQRLPLERAHAVSVWMHRCGFLHIGYEW